MSVLGANMTLEGCSIYDNTAVVRAHACAASPFALGLVAPPQRLASGSPHMRRTCAPALCSQPRRARVPAARCVHMRPALGWSAGVVRVQRPLWRWWRGEEGAGVHCAVWADGVVFEVGGWPRWVVLDVGCAGGGRGAIRVGIAVGGVCGGVARGGGVRARFRLEEAW